MLRSVDLSDYMLHNPFKVAPDDDVFSAINIMIENKITGVCVVDENEKLLGVLSELDCLKAILSATYNEEASVGNVSDFMTSDLDACGLHEDVVDVAADMLKKSQRRRPVIDETGKLVGQITCRQLLKVVSQFNQK